MHVEIIETKGENGWTHYLVRIEGADGQAETTAALVKYYQMLTREAFELRIRQDLKWQYVRPFDGPGYWSGHFRFSRQDKHAA